MRRLAALGVAVMILGVFAGVAPAGAAAPKNVGLAYTDQFYAEMVGTIVADTLLNGPLTIGASTYRVNVDVSSWVPIAYCSGSGPCTATGLPITGTASGRRLTGTCSETLGSTLMLLSVVSVFCRVQIGRISGRFDVNSYQVIPSWYDIPQVGVLVPSPLPVLPYNGFYKQQ
jgi:hypothetical protein